MFTFDKVGGQQHREVPLHQSKTRAKVYHSFPLTCNCHLLFKQPDKGARAQRNVTLDSKLWVRHSARRSDYFNIILGNALPTAAEVPKATPLKKTFSQGSSSQGKCILHLTLFMFLQLLNYKVHHINN